MRPSPAGYIILAVLAGTVNIVNSASGHLPRQLVTRAAKGAVVERRSEKNTSPQENTIDLTNAEHYARACYEREDFRGSIVTDDCSKLLQGLENSDDIATCEPGKQMYYSYNTCAVFLAVAQYAKQNYSIKGSSFVKTISKISKCPAGEYGFFGGYIELKTPENQAFYDNNPSSTLRAPVVTALFYSPDLKGDNKVGKALGDNSEKGEKIKSYKTNT
ncbi:expressed protein [Phakopsora pachyrhizi]|uniref:Expressed protein n=1 Tax=Phakopsora pachyrhizi TaxID=170000 RepID=A0AAV0ALH0_PHAPC|nr:expressed protein [Phakopsora pachyrhizi]CAH7683004.1 expressed protein [Phakopsora pachyrhizi]